MEQYNPIVRVFNLLRAALMRSGIARHHLCPDMPLELLLPAEQRREVWSRLRQGGLNLPDLELPPNQSTRNHFLALELATSFALGVKAWPGLIAFIPFRLLADWLSRSRAVHFPLGLKTVGELVLYLIRFRDHKQSGYRWTHNDISTKVRLIVAEVAAAKLENVQPETNLMTDLGLC